MIKVVHILSKFIPTGAEQMAVHLMRTLDCERFEVAAVSMFNPTGTVLEEVLARSGIPVWYLDKRPGFDPRMFTRVARVVRRFRPHVVHTHLHILRYVLPVASYWGAPALVHTVHSLAEKDAAGWPDRSVCRMAFRHGVTPVAIGQEVASSLTRLYGISGFPLIPNGIPIDTYRYPRVTREQWRSREGFAPEDTLFVCAASLTTQKNHALLLEAFAQGPASSPRSHLLLAGGTVGEEALKSRLEEQTRALGLQGRVRFMGVRADIPELLGAADVFVLSSSWEGNPLSVMEAMSAGKPVVSTAVGEIPRLVEDGKCGLLVPNDNAKALAKAMSYLLENPEACQAMGEAAAKRAIERFDIQALTKAYEVLYEKLRSKKDRHLQGDAATLGWCTNRA